MLTSCPPTACITAHLNCSVWWSWVKLCVLSTSTVYILLTCYNWKHLKVLLCKPDLILVLDLFNGGHIITMNIYETEPFYFVLKYGFTKNWTGKSLDLQALTRQVYDVIIRIWIWSHEMEIWRLLSSGPRTKSGPWSNCLHCNVHVLDDFCTAPQN